MPIPTNTFRAHDRYWKEEELEGGSILVCLSSMMQRNKVTKTAKEQQQHSGIDRWHHCKNE